MKKFRLTWSLLLGLLAVCPAFAGELEVELLPHGRPFRLTFADPREIRMALSVAADSQLNAAVGNYFSLVGVESAKGAELPFRAHFGLEGAGYFTMRQADARFPLESVDGLIGAYAESALGPWQMQLRYTHISAHLADGTDDRVSIPYSREILALRFAYAPTPDLDLYIGGHTLAHTVPLVPGLGAQVGGSYFWEGLFSKASPFIAADVQWRQEWVVNPSLSVQLGIALNNPGEAYRSFRFFYAYYTGADPRGQFFTTIFTSNSFGIEMQI